MKKLFLVSAFFALAAVSAFAQGTIKFNNDNNTKITTNLVVAGATTRVIGSIDPQYRFALFCSTNAIAVNGQMDAIAGGTNVNYAFNDGNWILVAYGTNSFGTGLFVSAAAPGGNGVTTVNNVPAGSTARFVVVGWSANAGTTVTALQSWFNGGSPIFTGWIGQSTVSGAITLGSGGNTATLFGTTAPAIKGFILGRVDPLAPVAPVITAQPVDKTAPVGAGVSFSVGSYGTPNPGYQWMFNTNTAITGATGPTLNLSNIQLTNAGTYSVVITNSGGSTNSYAATLTVNPPSAPSSSPGYVIFANYSGSVSKIYTNTSVGGPATGLTVGNYDYALFVSTNATSVNGQTAAIVGADSSDYAFADGNWFLAAYGTNFLRGMLSSTSANISGRTLVPGIAAGVGARFVVIGWSAGIGSDAATAQAWFNNGSPSSDGWIGQSAVSGSIVLGDGGSIPTQQLFSTNANALQGFTLGLVSPVAHAAYSMPVTPPALVQTSLNGNLVTLSWPTASGNFGVQSADGPVGPWNDTGWTVTTNGANSYVSVPPSEAHKYFRLVVQ